MTNIVTSTFFETSPVSKPYALMDLDDTLFQTARKMQAWQMPTDEPLICATVNRQGEPLSFMTPKQAQFFNWLHASTELIVVTARDVDEIKRVKLPFDSWQVLTHGAVILQADGQPLQQWKAYIHSQLIPLQDKLKRLAAIVMMDNTIHHQDFKLTIHRDNFDVNAKNEVLVVYLAVKHKQKDPDALKQAAQVLPELMPKLAEDFYIHINGNNLAVLPHAIHKQHAVEFLLNNHLDDNRACFGFGDSLADLPFLQQLDWYGMPNHGQLHEHVKSC